MRKATIKRRLRLAMLPEKIIEKIHLSMKNISDESTKLGGPFNHVWLEAVRIAFFNKLPARDKWDTWREQVGTWHCRECGTELSDGPRSAGPFSRTTVHCGNCDAELTRRHGGGQNEPFNWILK
jgi:hypothetical protein